MFMILFVYGSGGLGKEMVDLAQYINRSDKCWDEICFIDDYINKTYIYNCNVIDFEKAKELQGKDEAECIVALGESALRQKLFDKCKQAGFKMSSLISPTAVISDTAVIGEGVIISHHVFVSSNCHIENNVLLQPTCDIGHDCIIKENSVISSFAAIAGNCTVGRNTYVGMSAAIREKVTIGNETIISMGAIVMNDIPDEMIAMGNPARPIKPNENKKVFKGGNT